MIMHSSQPGGANSPPPCREGADGSPDEGVIEAPLGGRDHAFVVLGAVAQEEVHMNWDHIAGRWQQLRGRIREQWGKLTDDDIDVIAGKRDQLVGLLQQRYGTTRDEIERQVQDFEKRLASAR